MFPVFGDVRRHVTAIQEELRQRRNVRQGLEGCVHVTGVPDILEANETPRLPREILTVVRIRTVWGI